MKVGETERVPGSYRSRWSHAGWLILVGTVCGALGLAVGTLIQGPGIPRGHASDFVEVREKGSLFVRPLLECERPREAAGNAQLTAVRSRVEGAVAAAVQAGRATHVSVYFRDLDAGTWFSINPVERFVPASLLKVPVLLAALQMAEVEPQFLRRPVRFEGRIDLTREQSVRPAEILEPGRDYPLGELVRRMIVHSDNNAARLVLDSLPPSALERVYGDLGVAFRGMEGDQSFMSVDDYASFFRILYNGAHFNPRSCEAALTLLAQRSFAGGLRAGVPAGIPVAAKFGEWRLHEAERDREQFHDCGVVYHPERPYLLCVMTRGPRFEPLDGVVAGISQEVFAEVDAAKVPLDLVAGIPGLGAQSR